MVTVLGERRASTNDTRDLMFSDGVRGVSFLLCSFTMFDAGFMTGFGMSIKMG